MSRSDTSCSVIFVSVYDKMYCDICYLFRFEKKPQSDCDDRHELFDTESDQPSSIQESSDLFSKEESTEVDEDVSEYEPGSQSTSSQQSTKIPSQSLIPPAKVPEKKKEEAEVVLETEELDELPDPDAVIVPGINVPDTEPKFPLKGN